MRNQHYQGIGITGEEPTLPRDRNYIITGFELRLGLGTYIMGLEKGQGWG